MNKLLVGLIWALPSVLFASDSDRAPRLLQPVTPEYPAVLKEQRVVGRADVVCLIDEMGDVRDVAVESASHEEFGRSAAKAVSGFKYEPGVKGGKTTGMRARIPVEFTLGEKDLARLEVSRTKEVLPPGPPVVPMAEVDELPELKKEIRPKTPAILQQNRRMGQTVMDFVVDDDGVPRDIHAVLTTQVECAAASQEAIRRWRFTPGTKGGQIVRTAMRVEMVFFPEQDWASGLRLRPGVLREKPDDSMNPGVEEKGVAEPPRPIKRTRISYPEEMARRGMQGRVMVQFIIDTRGHVSRVQAVEQTNQFFAAVAEREVSYWRFHPGKINGRPVNVRASQLVEFEIRR